MEQNKVEEESLKTKSIQQFSARISEELKYTIDTLGTKTGKSKPELLDEFVRIYQTHIANERFSEIDLSKYDNLSNPLKESVYSAFTHILNMVNGNLSTLKQEVIHIKDEEKRFQEREDAHKSELESIEHHSAKELLSHKEEIDTLKTEMDTQVTFWKEKATELDVKNIELHKEFNNLNKIADQVQIVTNENRELRKFERESEINHKNIQNNLSEQLKLLSDELFEVKNTLYKIRLENDNKDEMIASFKEDVVIAKKEKMTDLDRFKNELIALSKDLSDTKNKYNKALGKLEILEKSETVNLSTIQQDS